MDCLNGIISTRNPGLDNPVSTLDTLVSNLDNPVSRLDNPVSKVHPTTFRITENFLKTRMQKIQKYEKKLIAEEIFSIFKSVFEFLQIL